MKDQGGEEKEQRILQAYGAKDDMSGRSRMLILAAVAARIRVAQ
jgi:hypothetical protein